MIRKPEQIIQDQVNPSQSRGGLGGLLDYAREQNPNTGLSRMQSFAAALDPLIMPEMRGGEAIRERGRERVAAGNVNKTVAYLRANNQEKLAGAVESGAIDAGQAINYMIQEASADKQFGRQQQLALFKNSLAGNVNVQSVSDLPDQSGVLVKMKDGSVVVKTSGGQELTGQAAMDFVQKSQSNYANLQKGIYQSREEGKLEAQADLIGDVEFQKKNAILRSDMIKLSGESMSKIKQNLANYQIALDALDAGEGGIAISGRISQFIPDITAAAQSLRTAKSKLGLDIIGSVTFGALSEGELKLAMDTGLPDDNLSPTELRKWISDRVDAQRKALAAVNDTLNHFVNQGSLKDYYTDIVGIDNGQSATQSDDDDPLGIR
tara:strand:- start:1708 stop:2841 length:1134 start_codon:yes stop_codon:yes gene_type:complete